LLLRLLNRVLTVIVIVIVLLMLYGLAAEIILPDSVGQDRDRGVSSAEELEATLQELEASEDGQGRLLSIAALLPVMLIAGFSDSIGHAVILFANQVKPNRIAVTVLFNALLFIVGYLIWVGMVAFISMTLFEQESVFVRSAFAVGISYLPLVYGFLIAFPYFGVLINNIMYLSAAVYLIGSLQLIFSYTQIEALICAILSFIAVIVFRLTVGRPILWMRGRLMNAVAGANLQGDIDDALTYIATKGAEE